MRIPPVVHQTWKRRRDPALRKQWATWAERSGLAYQCHDDDDCLAFVRAEFPELEDDYLWLRPGAERADLFRYLVIFARGGFYADMDTTCQVPVAQWGLPADCALVVGHEVPELVQRRMSKRSLRGVGLNWPERQLGQFCFGAAPRHPALGAVVEEVVRNVRRARAWDAETLARARADEDFTLELTGPGPWTRAVTPFLGTQGTHVFGYLEGFGGCHAPSKLVRHECKGTWRPKSLKNWALRNVKLLVVVIAILLAGLLTAWALSSMARRRRRARPPTASRGTRSAMAPSGT